MLKLKIKTKHYRLSLSNDETHEMIHMVRFSGIAFWVGLVLSVIVLFGAVYTVLVFTPLHFSIPGYPDAHFRSQAMSNALKIDSLESAVTRWELYARSISEALDGKRTIDYDSVLALANSREGLEKDPVFIRQQDSILKAKVSKEEQFGLSDTKRNLSIDGIHFFSPVKGIVTNGFDRAVHPAIDITAPSGTVIKSVLEGTVIFSGWSDEYGYTITIQHKGDLISTYKHNRQLLKKVGDKVQAGTPIAHMGSTGSTSNGDHLHFELWYKGESVDPAKYISF